MPKPKLVVENTDHIDKRVEQYLWIRGEIERIEKANVEALKKHRLTKEKIAGELLEFLDKNHLKSARTAFGLVTVLVKPTSPLTDPDAFIEFVRENDAYELLNRAANPTACLAYAEEHGSLPPGVKINSRRTIGVTKS
jgi:hypothetical protein